MTRVFAALFRPSVNNNCGVIITDTLLYPDTTSQMLVNSTFGSSPSYFGRKNIYHCKCLSTQAIVTGRQKSNLFLKDQWGSFKEKLASII